MTAHGTYDGFLAHLNTGDPMCQPCQDAGRARLPLAAAMRGRSPVPHGTPAGYRSHMATDKKACPPCRQAWGEYKGRLAAERQQERERIQRERDRLKAQRTLERMVRIPAAVLALAVDCADQATLAALDAAIGTDRLDEILRARDEVAA
ncbi:hypothetical protein O4215_20420 [Rhodococcus maanshanensis]|uniref:hypothetical protein n=1 Tax=Rhodococcus maanshanensis TaxID=183556 RepID=UPI0022B4B202|nr:hypothetical protein [Rhodococcus maanshanensis]MCZ4557929.1 hypothetical protein [Rhodococcus maanshanensis]